MHSLGRRTPDCIKLELPENYILLRVANFNQIYSTRFTLYENDNLIYIVRSFTKMNSIISYHFSQVARFFNIASISFSNAYLNIYIYIY